MEKADFIGRRVHELYWQQDINCARTTLICLAECFNTVLQEQTLAAAIGLHGAGGYRAQCGLVEGSLMFIGIYGRMKGKTDRETARICYEFAIIILRISRSISRTGEIKRHFSRDTS